MWMPPFANTQKFANLDSLMTDCKSEHEHLLLVEGVNDCHSVAHLFWLFHKADPHFGIHECGNDNGVLDSLAARLVSSQRKQKVLGVILDSDIEGLTPDQVIASRLDQLVSRAGQYYHLPGSFPSDGLIVDPLSSRLEAARLPTLGVWLMPNNRSHGMFEDLLMQSMSLEALEYTRSIVLKAREDRVASFRDIHLSKSIVRTYLAWQDPPDIPFLGLAIRKGTFERIRTECRPFLKWLEALFGLPPSSGS
jgi:hypothetical protein